MAAAALAAAPVPDEDLVVSTVSGLWDLGQSCRKSCLSRWPKGYSSSGSDWRLSPRVASWASLLASVVGALKTQFLPSSALALPQASSALQMPVNL